MKTENDHIDRFTLEAKSFWTYEECAAYLGVSTRFVRDHVARFCNVILLGERTKFLERDDVFRFLRAKKIICEAIC